MRKDWLYKTEGRDVLCTRKCKLIKELPDNRAIIEATNHYGHQQTFNVPISHLIPPSVHYRVFPDYLATGIWEMPPKHANVEYDAFPAVPEALLIALKYWVHVWEMSFDEDVESSLASMYYRQWWLDGQTIVDAMNDSQDEYFFVYDVETP